MYIALPIVSILVTTLDKVATPIINPILLIL
jgi:hypothetical protein